MSRAVLDASAILALFRRERGAEVVAGYRGDAVASSVNVAEVVSRLSDEGLNPTQWHYAVTMLELEVVAFDESQAIASGRLRNSTRHRVVAFDESQAIAGSGRLRNSLRPRHRWASVVSLARRISGT